MLRIELDTAALEAALDRLQGGLGDLSKPMQDIGELVAESTRKRLRDSEGPPDGGQWAARSPFNRARDPRILIDSGDMLGSIFYRSGADYAEIGVTAIQARTLHFGAAKGAFGNAPSGQALPWGDIPARPFLGLSDPDRSAIAEALQEWIDGLAEGS